MNELDIPTVQTKAYCQNCNTFHDIDALEQSWCARDELVCPQCRSVVPDKYRP